MKIRSFMTRNVTCVSPEDSLVHAYELMRDGEMRHLPVVVENNVLVGLLSERDVLLRASLEDGGISIPDIDVSTVMTTELVTCRQQHQMEDVASIMLERKVDAMPVTDESGELIGIITAADFVEYASRKSMHHEIDSYKRVPFNFTINRFKPEAKSYDLPVNLRPRSLNVEER